MIEKRLKEILARRIEIRAMIEIEERGTEGAASTMDAAAMDALEKELAAMESEEQLLRRKQALAQSMSGAPSLSPTAPVTAGELRTLDTGDGDRQEDDPRSAPEYRRAYLRNLQGKALTPIEERALTTAAGSAGSAVPTSTLNMIIDKLRQTSVLFPRITVSYVPGRMSLVIANAKNAASWKAEGSDGQVKDDTVINIELGGFELIKLVEISAAASAMTIDAFEAYITAELGRQMSIAIENAILNGSGSGEPTGILNGITFGDTNSATFPAAGIGYDAVVEAIALLPTMYHNGAVFVMNRKMLWGGIRKVTDNNKQPLFIFNPQLAPAMSILGYGVIVDDYMPDDTILFGDLAYYYMNFNEAPSVAASREAGFKSGKITYRGLAVADGKPALDEAFVRLTKSA